MISLQSAPFMIAMLAATIASKALGADVPVTREVTVAVTLLDNQGNPIVGLPLRFITSVQPLDTRPGDVPGATSDDQGNAVDTVNIPEDERTLLITVGRHRNMPLKAKAEERVADTKQLFETTRRFAIEQYYSVEIDWRALRAEREIVLSPGPTLKGRLLVNGAPASEGGVSVVGMSPLCSLPYQRISVATDGAFEHRNAPVGRPFTTVLQSKQWYIMVDVASVPTPVTVELGDISIALPTKMAALQIKAASPAEWKRTAKDLLAEDTPASGLTFVSTDGSVIAGYQVTPESEGYLVEFPNTHTREVSLPPGRYIVLPGWAPFHQRYVECWRLAKFGRPELIADFLTIDVTDQPQPQQFEVDAAAADAKMKVALDKFGTLVR